MAKIGEIEGMKYSFAAMVNKNLASEADAEIGYQELLSSYGEDMEPEEVAMIRELIADEKNHALKLMALAKKYDEIAPTPDALQDAAKELFAGLFKA